MSTINNSSSFMKRRVTILRPAIAVDVTRIRDKVLTSYTVINTNVRVYLEQVGSERIMNSQLGGIPVDRWVGFFSKGTNIKINDVIKEDANAKNGNVIQYWDVVGNMVFMDWVVRCDLDLKAYHRGQ